MAEEDDSAPSTEISSCNEEDEGKSDSSSEEDEGEVAEYTSEDEEEDEVVEELTLEEELEIERRNLLEAKRRISNLITQVTEYQQEMDQNRQELKHKMDLVSQEHQRYEDSLQEEIEKQQRELEKVQYENSELKKKHVNALQTMLTEIRELDQKNTEYQNQLDEVRQARPSNATQGDLISGLTLGNEQLNKILSMLQNIYTLCNNGSKFHIPPIDEIISTEKQKLVDEQKHLEQQLVVEQKKKEDALVFMASQPENSNTHYFKKIEETRKRIEQERTNAQMNTVHITGMNNRLADLKDKVFQSNEALMAERSRLAAVEEQIKELRQELIPLHIKAKAMQIENTEVLEPSVAMTASAHDSNAASGRAISPTNIGGPKSETNSTSRDLLRAGRFGGTIRGPLVRAPSHLTRANSDANFIKLFDQGGLRVDDNLSPGRIILYVIKYLLLSDPPLSGMAYCMTLVNKTVWVGCSDGSIRIYDKDTARILAHLTREPASAVICMEIVAREVWTGHQDGSVKIWTANGIFRDAFEAHTGQVVSIVKVDTSTVWTIGRDKMIRSWNTRTRRNLKTKETDSLMMCMQYDGSEAVWIGADSQILLWDPKTLREVNTLTQHTKLVHHLLVVTEPANIGSSITKTMWSSSSDNSICVWDINAQYLLIQIPTRIRGLNMVEFGNDVWCSAYNKSILRIDKRTRRVLHRYEDAHGDAVSALVVVPDDCGSRVWSGSWDKCISIWKSDHAGPKTLTPKQKATIIANWRQLFHGTNGTILSENCDVEETSSALAVIGKLLSFLCFFSLFSFSLFFFFFFFFGFVWLELDYLRLTFFEILVLERNGKTSATM